MNWKTFKKFLNTYMNDSEQKPETDETKFILGIDLGSSTSAIAYYDWNHKQPEIIDMSGGYGKPSVPTVIQYIPETKEWVYFEYAILNKGYYNDITISNLISKIGHRDFVEIDGRSVSIATIVGKYIKELISSCRSINPRAEIVGIVVAIPNYFSENEKEELLLSFKLAGYEKEFITFITERECILNKYHFYEPIQKEKILIIDYGSKEARGGVVDINPISETDVEIKCLSSIVNENIGVKNIEDEIVSLFKHYYCEETKSQNITSEIYEQIKSFSYTHKDLILQNNQNGKATKVYFNFAYPPFQKTITEEAVKQITEKYKIEFETFLNDIFKKVNDDTTSDEITAIICAGGGFEMTFAKETIQNFFPKSKIKNYKNAKAIISEGAAISASRNVGLLQEIRYIIEDKSKREEDIGIKIMADKKEKFLTLVENNAFWWQKHKNCILIVNQSTESPTSIELFKRDHAGEINKFYEVILADLPKRPKGTTRINLSLEFLKIDTMNLKIEDYGFGEMFPKTDYSRNFIIRE